MTHNFHIRMMTVVFIASCAAPAFADQQCKPVEGHFEAGIVLPGEGHCPDVPGAFCTAGRVWGGIQGNYQFVMTGAVPAALVLGEPSTVLFFTGKSDVLLKSGDHLLGTDTGSIDLPPGEGGFASLITWNDGTGKMTGASGQIRLRGEFDPTAGTTAGDYLGTVCTP